MPVNGVRVLPDIPKNIPNMEILIQEFETGFCSMSASCRDITSKSSALSDGNFVKKIVEAYESSIRASNENSQWERIKERSYFFNTLDVIKNDVKNRKNVEKYSSSPAIYDAPSSQCRNNFKKKSKIFTPFEAREVEDDFVILNQCHPKSDVSEIRLGSSPKINMYSSMGELSMDVQSSPSKRNEIWNLKKRNKKLEDKTKRNKLMICSSPLENVENKDLDCEDPLDDILTSSYDSSSNNSYRNLQADLYSFEDELELSSTSSWKFSSRSSHNNILSVNNNDCSMLLDSSFQDLTVTSSKDILEDRENLRDSELVPSPSSEFDQKSPGAIDASLNKDRPIKFDNDTCATWISALGEKLSQKKPLKNLLKSAFNSKLLNYKKVWKNSAEKQPNERASDSGFIERFLSSSSSSQKSWRSDPNEKPTFGTFGRAKNTCGSDKTWSKSSRMVLTEVPREKFTSDSEPSDSTLWTPLPDVTTSYKENHGNVESSLKSTMLTSSSKLKASCEYPSLPKHPYLIRNGIPKHPFVAKTKLDQATEKESVEEKEMGCDAKERESDTRELESSSTSSQIELNNSYPKISEWLASSRYINYDLLRSRPCKSTSALDGLVSQQTLVNNVHTLCNFSTDFLSTNNLYVQREPCTHRYATVSPKNLRFSMSREKLRAIERSFDA